MTHFMMATITFLLLWISLMFLVTRIEKPPVQIFTQKQYSSFVDIKVKVRSRLLSGNSMFFFNIIWIDEMQLITESKLFSDKHHL